VASLSCNVPVSLPLLANTELCCIAVESENLPKDFLRWHSGLESEVCTASTSPAIQVHVFRAESVEFLNAI